MGLDLLCPMVSPLIDNVSMTVVKEFCYFGVQIKADKSLHRCTKSMIVKFYKCFYAIFRKVKGVHSEVMLMNLLKLKCLPILQYACDVFPPSNAELRHLDRIVFCVMQEYLKRVIGTLLLMLKKCIQFRIHILL